MTMHALHTFHIPVMGLGFTIDTPLKVARYGISSVVSIVEDNLVEQMRKFHCEKEGERYIPIEKSGIDFRAERITAYLNLLNRIVTRQVKELKESLAETNQDMIKYFRMLPDNSPVKKIYSALIHINDKSRRAELIRNLADSIIPGKVDVNIMTKCDRTNYRDGEALPAEYSDAMSALRGFANSELDSSVVFSAGMNPRLYSYCEKFPGFFPDSNGMVKKKIILKVSDFRSALIQGKFLAKKGLWVSEFRIESGLNCGGHAFPTDGFLLGPILEEFRQRKSELTETLSAIYTESLITKGFQITPSLDQKISVQGGVGTSEEHEFLLEYYKVDSVGWGSPFLLVPEVTNVDKETLNALATANESDYYLSHSSPLGVPFNNFRKSSSEKQRQKRIERNRPGSPCYKKFLAFDTEFTAIPICTASREYQNLKLKQIETTHAENINQLKEEVMEKDCLCEGLAVSAFMVNGIKDPHKLNSVTICPGPNLAYFSGTFSLDDMTDHIYGRKNILNSVPRPSMFIKELRMYVHYLETEIIPKANSVIKRKYIELFCQNLTKGINYYIELFSGKKSYSKLFSETMLNELMRTKSDISKLVGAFPEKI